MTRNPNDALVREHLQRHPELALQMAPATTRAPKLSAFALAAAPGDREVIAARESKHQVMRARGRAAQASGASTEALIDAHHAYAFEHGIAYMEHLHAPVVVLRTLERGRFEGRYVARSGPDYFGILRGRVPVVVEVKSAGDQRLALVDDGSEKFGGLAAHQRAALDAMAAFGGVALVVVRFVRRVRRRPVEKYFAVPWGEIASRTDIGPDDDVVAPWAMDPVCYLTRWAGGSAW